jgi:hypothetical protein
MGAFECSWFMSKPFLFLTVLTVFLLSFSHGEVALFNGQDLSGWQAQDMSYWSVVDGAIVGTAGEKKIKGNQFLWHEREVRDFHLSLSVRQFPFAANAGIQFRSQPRAGGSAFGYQADVGKGWWGTLYHEHGRGILAKSIDAGGEHLNQEGWNQYEILVIGPDIWLSLNGKISVALHDPEGERSGRIALQLHGGMPQRVEYKGLTLTENPKGGIAGFNQNALREFLQK